MSISHYQRVISLLPEAALIVTPTGRVVATNSRGAQLLVCQDATDSIFDFLQAESREHAADYLRQCARNGQALVGSLIFDGQSGAETYTSYGALLEPRSEDREAAILVRLQPRNEHNIKFSALKQQN